MAENSQKKVLVPDCKPAIPSFPTGLKHTFKYWTEESLVTLFKVFVRPHLDYCIQACTPTLRRDIETLEKVQRRATKLVPSLRNLPYEDRLRPLKSEEREGI